MKILSNKKILVSILLILLLLLILVARQVGLRIPLRVQTEVGPGGRQPELNKVFKEYYRIGGVNFGVGVMVVTIKDIDIGNKEVLLVGSYQNNSGQEETVQIFVGNINDRGTPTWIAKIVDKDKNQLVGGSDGVTTFADRTKNKVAEIHFFVDVTDYQKVISGTDYCKEFANFCILAERSVPYMYAYNALWFNRQKVSAGIPLNALFVKVL